MKEIINVTNEFDVFITVYSKYIDKMSEYCTGSGMKSASEEAIKQAEIAYNIVIDKTGANQ